MNINTDEMVQQCIDAINKEIRDLKTLNIMVVGKSGVGKSTLINSVFRGNFADVGVGKPVTQEIRKIEKKDYPMAIYDTPGFELSSTQQEDVKEEILKIIRKGYASKDTNEAIHCIWYCVNVGGNRTFDDSEISWLRNFTEENKDSQVPIIVVLTQAVPKSKATEMRRIVEKENLDIVKVVPVLARDIDFDGEYVARAYGLDRLINIMAEILPDELKKTLENVQKASLESKIEKSKEIVAKTVATTFGEGFVPIPLADSAMMIPTQITMIARITAVFGLDINKAFLTVFVSSTIGSAGATVLGKTVVASLIKLIPGAGAVAGTVISGTTAGLITTALGEAYIQIMKMMYTGEIKKEDLQSKKVKVTMKTIFRTELKTSGLKKSK